MNNLYPVLYYLGVPLKYICCKSQGNVELIKKRTDIMATTSLADIMTDDEIKGVFVSVSVDTNFEISKKVLDSGKSLFVEKPPCRSKKELDCLIDLADKIFLICQLFIAICNCFSKSSGFSFLKLNREFINNFLQS